MGWDLFCDHVLGFPLFQEDFGDAAPWIREGRLDVRLLSPDLMFVMKALTPRTRDIADMAVLITSGAATRAGIDAIVAARIAHDPLAPWIGAFYQGALDMALEHDMDTRWIDKYQDHGFRALVAARLQESLAEGPMTLRELAAGARADERAVREILEALHQQQVVRVVDGRWALRA